MNNEVLQLLWTQRQLLGIYREIGKLKMNDNDMYYATKYLIGSVTAITEAMDKILNTSYTVNLQKYDLVDDIGHLASEIRRLRYSILSKDKLQDSDFYVIEALGVCLNNMYDLQDKLHKKKRMR